LTRRKKLGLSEYLPYLVNRLGAALVMRFSEDALARHDLSIAMWRVLVALSDNGPRRQIDLSEITSVDVSTLSRLIARLVQMGLVTRVRSNHSHREVTVALTSQAEKLIGELIPIARRLERTAISGLPAAELQATKTALRGMYQNLMPPRGLEIAAAKVKGMSTVRQRRRPRP
jgi:MarR family transcriptional regulator, organic hydroperoxide resistance regulator